MTDKKQALPKSDKLLAVILSALDANKAEDIVDIDIRGKSSIADFMVICSGTSSRQISALGDRVEKEIKETYPQCTCRIEGKSQGDWVLLDANDVIVHIFRPDVREFYNLEKIWQSPEDRSPKVEKVIVTS